jgi:hypothetical protein
MIDCRALAIGSGLQLFPFKEKFGLHDKAKLKYLRNSDPGFAPLTISRSRAGSRRSRGLMRPVVRCPPPPLRPRRPQHGCTAAARHSRRPSPPPPKTPIPWPSASSRWRRARRGPRSDSINSAVYVPLRRRWRAPAPAYRGRARTRQSHALRPRPKAPPAGRRRRPRFPQPPSRQTAPAAPAR